jgi:hypothetical protein
MNESNVHLIKMEGGLERIVLYDAIANDKK